MFIEDEPALPERFQNYQLDMNRVGSGPVGFIYRAQRLDSNQTVRLKIIRRRICGLLGIDEMCQTINKVSSSYRGAGVINYNLLSKHDNLYIFETAYHDSISLKELIEQNAPFHPDLAVLIVSAIMEGLNQIHGSRPSPGMGNRIPLHRNVKAENILITKDGQVLLTDLEMQQITEFCDKKRLELPYPKDCYQSPEQLLRSGYADRRSDIFSLGVILTEMLFGKLPQSGGNIFESRQNIREGVKVKLAKLLPTSHDKIRTALSKNLIKLIEKMTLFDADKRIQSLIDIESWLDKYLQGVDYHNREKSIRGFIESGYFESKRKRKLGFIDKLFGK